LEGLIEKNYHLHKSSREGYKSYIHAYQAHALKDCFDVSKLDLQKIAKSFGFGAPPKVELNIKCRTKRENSAFKKNKSGHAFSASNSNGKRAEGDKRQFTH
jgi:ATP-dependent RNA helicase DDX18/HAS1